MRLSVGPILTYWPRQEVFDFYLAMADTQVDIVYLGETVCSRRHELRLSDWLDIAQMLQEHGKEVVLSTQVLIESNSELQTLRKIADNGKFRVEANDMGAVHLLAGRIPFVAGPHLNVYNAETLALMQEFGAFRWHAPHEMNQESLRGVLEEAPRIETEVFGYGRLPLAYSARCFTARNRNLPKDDCRYTCLEYPDGLPLRTKEGQPFLVLNGIQTQSARIQCLVREVPAMPGLGVDVLRVSPQHRFTADVVDVFDRVRRGDIEPAAGAALLYILMRDDPCDGYWHGKPGLEYSRGAEA
ncbi:MAG: U32 family peptidase [Telluria sp.]